MKEDKWIRQLHDKLANHEVDVPEGLWADIEALVQEQAQVKPARFVAWRKWAVAASLLVAVSGAAVWWLSQSGNGSIETPSVSAEIVEPLLGHSEDDTDLLARVESDMPQQHAELPKTRKALRQTHHEALVPDPAVARINSGTVSEKEPSLSETVHDNHSGSNAQQTETKRAQVDHWDRSTEKELERQIAQLSTGHSHPVSIGLFATNGFGSQTGSNGVLMTSAMAKSFNHGSMARRMEPVYLADFKEQQKHHAPVSLGLQVGYPLSRRLSLSTGVVYTWQHSEFDYLTYGQKTSRKQTLHYIGVPLNIDGRLWFYRGLNVYVGAGVQADWNVSVRVETEGVRQPADKDRMQWSAGGKLGVQYNIIPQLGFYVEPSVRYYFDNGSQVQNYFKSNPTCLGLQLGLRLNLASVNE